MNFFNHEIVYEVVDNKGVSCGYLFRTKEIAREYIKKYCLNSSDFEVREAKITRVYESFSEFEKYILTGKKLEALVIERERIQSEVDLPFDLILNHSREESLVISKIDLLALVHMEIVKIEGKEDFFKVYIYLKEFKKYYITELSSSQVEELERLRDEYLKKEMLISGQIKALKENPDVEIESE